MPGYGVPYDQMGIVSLLQGRYAVAIADWRRAVRMSPASTIARNWAAVAANPNQLPELRARMLARQAHPQS